MARKRKGRDISGWLIVDKPAGVTSTSVVNKVKWALEAKKAGHAGTLDPSATGLLAVALGEATKTVPYVTDALKAYSFAVRWGAATNTDDAEGEIVETSNLRPTEDAIKEAIPAFLGDIMQVPPAFSAVKIDGERAYKKARDGEELELSARPLWVDELLLADIPDDDTAILEMTCGKGGYVRSIARDMGRRLGCFGHVVTLRRLWSGPFDLSKSMTWEQIETMARTPAFEDHLLPLEQGLEGLPELRALEGSAGRLRNGNPAEAIGDAEFGDTVWVSHEGAAVAIGTYRGGLVQPQRVIAAH
ncbi:MAG: tRNA pseudouridine(55) synthase TruB [Marinovum sp.]|nr:tRNA pseudouridine(55) synthase TruB [Marinovum sp.]